MPRVRRDPETLRSGARDLAFPGRSICVTDTSSVRLAPQGLRVAANDAPHRFRHFQDAGARIACHGSQTQPSRKRPMMMVGFSWIFIGLAAGFLAPLVVPGRRDAQLPVA